MFGNSEYAQLLQRLIDIEHKFQHNANGLRPADFATRGALNEVEGKVAHIHGRINDLIQTIAVPDVLANHVSSGVQIKGLYDCVKRIDVAARELLDVMGTVPKTKDRTKAQGQEEGQAKDPFVTEPFATQRNDDGIIWIDAKADAAFRRAFLDGVPRNLYGKMRDALSETPDGFAMEFSVKYFGKELTDIKNQIAPLLIAMNKYLTEQRNMPGLFDWLQATNYGNSQKLIIVLKEWSEMKISDVR